MMMMMMMIWVSVGLGKQNMNASATGSLDNYELKQRKPWFDEECSKLFDGRKQPKLQ